MISRKLSTVTYTTEQLKAKNFEVKKLPFFESIEEKLNSTYGDSYSKIFTENELFRIIEDLKPSSSIVPRIDHDPHRIVPELGRFGHSSIPFVTY